MRFFRFAAFFAGRFAAFFAVFFLALLFFAAIGLGEVNYD